jgi:hypothetical protein
LVAGGVFLVAGRVFWWREESFGGGRSLLVAEGFFFGGGRSLLVAKGVFWWREESFGGGRSLLVARESLLVAGKVAFWWQYA